MKRISVHFWTHESAITVHFLILLMLMGTSLSAAVGDINEDGVVNQADVLMVEEHVINKAPLTGWPQAWANVNQTGDVDVGDLIAIKRLAEGNFAIVPDVSYEGRHRAENLIREAGLVVGEVITVRSSSYPSTVAGQVPRGGTGLAPGSAVDLHISGGSEGAYLEILPTEVDLGVSGTTATFQVISHGADIPWIAGMWADFTASPSSGVGNGTTTLELDRTHLPMGDSSLNFAVVPDVGGNYEGAYATVRLNQTVHPPPRLDYITGRQPRSPGDIMSIDGSYFAADPEDNEISINGVVTKATGVGMGPVYVNFTIPEEVKPGMVEIRARRMNDPTFGPSSWGRPIVTRLVQPIDAILNHGRDGHQLALGTYYVSRISPTQWLPQHVEPGDWVLGGRNFSLLDGVNHSIQDNEWRVVSSSSDTFAVEIVVEDEPFFIPAARLSDTEISVIPRLMLARQDEFRQALLPGETYMARLWASDPANGQLRTSDWIELTTAESAPPIGSILEMNITRFELYNQGVVDWKPGTIIQLAKGTTLMLTNLSMTEPTLVSAPGLWEGEILFRENDRYSNAPGMSNLAIELNTPGSYLLTNHENGNTRVVEVLDGGAPEKWFPDGDYVRSSRSIYNLVLPEDRPVKLFSNGATVEIPAGALPTEQGQENMVSLRYRHVIRSDDFEMFDPEAEDGGDIASLTFGRAPTSPEDGSQDWTEEWSPQALIRPITLRMFYSSTQAINGPPAIGTLDQESLIYWELPTTVDPATKSLAVVFPAGTYGATEASRKTLSETTEATDDAGRKMGTPSGFPPIPLYQITRTVGIPYIRSERSQMTDDEGRFIIDYISDSNSSSYASHEYAEGILTTMVAAHNFLKGKSWRVPDGPTTIYLRKTWTGGYGSTTKAVFGRPTVTINVDNCPQGSAAYYTTAAHEVAHVFQREYTTNVIAKWFDEATAEWVALKTIGTGSFLGDNINSYLAFHKTLPLSFTFGYSMDEGYAAVAWANWLEENYSGTLQDVYESLDGNPLAWEDHRGTVADATGKSISTLYRDFAREFWIQSLDPMGSVDLTGLANEGGRKVDHFMTDSGDISFTDTRPILSSIRYSVEPDAACLAKFAGRQAVIRITHTTDAALSEVMIYGDRAGASTVPNQPSEIGVLEVDGELSLLLDNPSEHRTYRFILSNGSVVNTFTPSVRMVYPTINTIIPSSGHRRGGYGIQIRGTGFGNEMGTLTVGGSAIDINSWQDDRINFTMPSVPDFVSTWQITPRTTEGAATNTVEFTFTDG